MNLANKLTIFRVILIPFFMFFLLTDIDFGSIDVSFYKIEWNIAIATIVFVIASFTDWYDGYWARKHGFVTDFGKFMDPLADKVLVTAALVGLVQLQWIPAWIVVVVLTREFAVTGLRMLISTEGEVLAANKSGKIKTVLQLFAIIVTMILPLSYTANILLYSMAIATVYSGLLYFKGYKHLINPNK